MNTRALFALLVLVPLAVLADDLTVSWGHNPPAENVTQYNVQLDDGMAYLLPAVVPETGGALSHTWADLPDGQYRARVNAENASGISGWAWSGWATIDTAAPSGAPPSKPTTTITLTVIHQETQP